jgi:hypothetical protein
MARVFCKKGECNEARRRRHEGKYGKDFSPDVIFLTLECGRNDLRLPMPDAPPKAGFRNWRFASYLKPTAASPKLLAIKGER